MMVKIVVVWKIRLWSEFSKVVVIKNIFKNDFSINISKLFE